MTEISLREIRKAYGAHEVIHGVDLQIGRGEFVALVGPSGCGKSTLLRMIAGLEGITGGELAIDGRRMNEVAPKDRDIAMVFQSYALYPHMTVAENMGFSLRLRRVERTEKDRRVREAARILGLEPLLERHPRELSGGQRQRVAMGRAIVRDPKVFLFDEPLSNLDAKLRVNTRAEIKALHQRLRTTTVYVTHDQIEAMTMADRIVVMNGGRIEQAGTPLELYDNPGNLFVAGFLGSPSMNFVSGSFDPARGVFQVEGGPEILVGTGLWGHRGKAILGLRPEHFALSPSGLSCRIELVEPTGAETHLLLGLGAQRISVVLRERPGEATGEAITLAPDLSRAHLFDPESGQRIPRLNG